MYVYYEILFNISCSFFINYYSKNLVNFTKYIQAYKRGSYFLTKECANVYACMGTGVSMTVLPVH